MLFIPSIFYMQKRNWHLADNSSACICYLTKPAGSTAYTVDYARRMGLRIINVAARTACKRAPYTCNPPELPLHWRRIQEAFQVTVKIDTIAAVFTEFVRILL